MANPVPEKNARIASVVAATGIALACGTNYGFSAWGPEFARHMKLSVTQGNVIGAAGNVGAYAMGVPAGLLIDSRGTRVGVLVGAIALACGYFPIHTAYDMGPGSMSVAFLSFCSFLTGAGSCTAFSAAIKTSAFNWPSHRGTATAFPLSGFGLSAFFFTTIGKLFLNNSTSDFLLLLAAGTLVLNGVSFFFLRLIPTPQAAIPIPQVDEGLSVKASAVGDPASLKLRTSSDHNMPENEREALVTRASSISELDREDFLKPANNPAVQQEITGLKLLSTFEFWQLFGMLALLAGVGLMTINNIGNDTGALWRHYDPKAEKSFIQDREKMHVGILSLCSCAGRFVSGVGSDILIKRLRASRFWCLVFSACIFIVAQILALITTNPNFLFLVSSLTGLGYGALFGCFPALTADAFGVAGLSLNWGFMIFAPVVSGNIFNIMYGRIFDANTPHEKDDQSDCTKGLGCYANAYWFTLASSILGVLGAFWCIRYEAAKRRKIAIGREA